MLATGRFAGPLSPTYAEQSGNVKDKSTKDDDDDDVEYLAT